MRWSRGDARMIVAALLGPTLVVAASSGCGRRAPGGDPREMTVSVVGFQAVAQPLEERVAVVGTLAANESVEIRSELEGLIEDIGVEEGQRVAAGDLLFRIDRKKLEASLAEAEANLKLADATLQRYAALAESRAVSQQEVDQAKMSFEARAAAVELMRAQLQDATVTAPFAGVVGARLISLGQYVTRGQSLTSLVDTDPMKAELNVPERFLSRLAEGQELEVRVTAYPEDAFRGTVYFVDPTVNPETRTVLIKARLPNPDGRLRPGMFANLQLVLRIREQALVIPETALLMQGDRTSVFVVDDQQQAQLRPVTIGLRLVGMAEVTSGVTQGEVVVVEGTQKLRPGAPVQVRFEEPQVP